LLKSAPTPDASQTPGNATAALTNIFSSAPIPTGGTRPRPTSTAGPQASAPAAVPPAPEAPAAVPSGQSGNGVMTKMATNASGDLSKLRMEIARLEGLVKKLQSELAAEREYVRSLEEHFKIAQQG